MVIETFKHNHPLERIETSVWIYSLKEIETGYMIHPAISIET